MCGDIQNFVHALKFRWYIRGFWLFEDVRGAMCGDVQNFNAYFEAQVLYCCWFCFFEGVRDQMCFGIQILMHILKPKCYIVLGLVLWRWARVVSKLQSYWVAISKPSSLTFLCLLTSHSLCSRLNYTYTPTICIVLASPSLRHSLLSISSTNFKSMLHSPLGYK